MKELIELISKKLVDHPDDVEVRVIENEDGQVFELRVHPDDMGRFIGNNGRVAKAVRPLIGSAAAKNNRRVTLNITR